MLLTCTHGNCCGNQRPSEQRELLEFKFQTTSRIIPPLFSVLCLCCLCLCPCPLFRLQFVMNGFIQTGGAGETKSKL